MAARKRNVFVGKPDEAWTNDTAVCKWQLIVQWHNSCGRCIQYDRSIANAWGLPIHLGCNCKAIPVFPGETSQPFVDFREKIQELTPEQQTRVMGRANLILVENGVVGWDDVVTRSRIWDLHEVVARKRLTVDQMVKAGVNPYQAQQAWDKVHTAAHAASQTQVGKIVADLKAKGLTEAEIKSSVVDSVIGRISGKGVTEWSFGGSTPPTPPRSPAAAAPTPPPPPAEPPAVKRAALQAEPPKTPQPKPKRPAPKPPGEKPKRPSPRTEAVTFGPSKADVWDWSDGKIEKTLGKPLTAAEIASITGAPNNAQVKVEIVVPGSVTVRIEGPDYRGSRRIYQDDGKLVIENRLFKVATASRGKGIGATMFGREVEQAAAAGVSKIHTNAARGGDYDGYKVWPKFGYDGPLSTYIRRKLQADESLPAKLRSATMMSDLYADMAGVSWWAEHGESIDLEFDLTPGSYSRRTWSAYLKRKVSEGYKGDLSDGPKQSGGSGKDG